MAAASAINPAPVACYANRLSSRSFRRRSSTVLPWARMDARDLALLAVAGYVAVMTLVRLMLRRHRKLLAEFRRQLRARRSARPADDERKAA